MEPIKIYPTIEELTTISTLVHCTETGCSSIFKSESNLNLHLVKSHKKEELAGLLSKQEPGYRQFHCPHLGCIYNEVKSFKTLKLVKQHYLKVHTVKDVLCAKCNKGFPTEAARNSHQEYCGINFACSDCEATYTCYDTLATHARRKKHKVAPKINFKPKSMTNMVQIVEKQLKKNMPLLPKPASTSQILILVNMSDKSSQTDIRDGQPKCKSRKTVREKRHDNITQTSKNKQPQLCAETQTVGDYITRKSSCDISSSSSTESLSRKSIRTQTNVVPLTTKSCNTSFNLNEYVDVAKASLGTQTLTMLSDYLENPSTSDLNFEFMNSSCQTSFNDNLDTFDSDNYFNCNTETQTDCILGDLDLLEPDFYANMCTQTCDDILTADMEFNNIHTQTAMDDVLRSVASQTMMTVCRDMAHNETQTEVAFKQMLEEINA